MQNEELVYSLLALLKNMVAFLDYDKDGSSHNILQDLLCIHSEGLD